MAANFRAAAFGVVISSETLSAVTASSAVALTVPAGSRAALITAGANPIRFRSDGTDPTATVGHFVAANGNVEVFRDEIGDIRLISTTGTSDVFVTYYGD